MNWTRNITGTAALLAIAALLTTIAGPALDHHFAERQASHGHVFAHQAYPDHGHMSDESHAHQAGESLAVGVIATGDGDVNGFGVDTPAPPVTYRFVDVHLGHRLAGIPADENLPLGRVSPPPVRPPIV